MDFISGYSGKNEFNVSDTGYFVYCNGDKQQPNFDNKVIFKVSVLEYNGNASWIEEQFFNIKDTAESKLYTRLQRKLCLLCLPTRC